MTQEDLADYGILKAYYNNWNEEDEEILTLLPTRSCTLADFGLDENKKLQN
jgi:hypothetical protein